MSGTDKVCETKLSLASIQEFLLKKFVPWNLILSIQTTALKLSSTEPQNYNDYKWLYANDYKWLYAKWLLWPSQVRFSKKIRIFFFELENQNKNFKFW